MDPKNWKRILSEDHIRLNGQQSDFMGFSFDSAGTRYSVVVTQLWPNPPPILPDAANRLG